jgi:SAM-dependent methyltransferase
VAYKSYMKERDRRRVEFGDWQTPRALAEEVVRVVSALGPPPASVLEPNCGQGTFLLAARDAFPGAGLFGFDISSEHLARARERLGRSAELCEADFFTLDWTAVIAELASPILVLGNPPWVTNSVLGALRAGNLPKKQAGTGERGLDALTGKSNFDISEWMAWRLVSALSGSEFRLALLVKASVARRVARRIAKNELDVAGSLYRIDARTHFAAAVDAVLLCLSSGRHTEEASWPVFESLRSDQPVSEMGVVGDRVVGDLGAFRRTLELEGNSLSEWRSGIKHDCAEVMELRLDGGALWNKLGERVEIESEFVYPLLKSSDLAKGKSESARRVIVTQSRLGDDTARIREHAPKTWAYLSSRQGAFAARKSRIYRGQPPFALFGVGAYSFQPHKVAVSGLYKHPRFTALGPIDGRPVMLDDTCYFVTCGCAESAGSLAKSLNGDRAREFFLARMFSDAKRPVNKALLQTLNLNALGLESP